jgi:hypothetical protein
MRQISGWKSGRFYTGIWADIENGQKSGRI